MKRLISVLFASVLLVAVAAPASAAEGYPTCYVADAAQVASADFVEFFIGPGTIERCRQDRDALNAAQDRAGRSSRYYLFDTTRGPLSARSPQNWYLGCTFDTAEGGGYQVLVNPSSPGYVAYAQQICDLIREYSYASGLTERNNPN